MASVFIYDGKYLPRDQPATAVAFKLFFSTIPWKLRKVDNHKDEKLKTSGEIEKDFRQKQLINNLFKVDFFLENCGLREMEKARDYNGGSSITASTGT